MRLLILLLIAAQLPAATKVFLKEASSLIQPSPSFVFRKANNTQGASLQTAVTNTIAGNVTGQYWPSPTAGHIITKTAAGTRTVWLSDPLSAGVTISGTITPNIWGLESATAANAAHRYEVMRWSVQVGGVVSSVGISSDGGMTEYGTSAAVRTGPTTAPTSTAFITGDRILILIYNDDGNGVTETAASRTVTLDYDAGTTVNGDTYLSFTETITFSADSNNARPSGLSSWLDWFRFPDFTAWFLGVTR